MKKFYVTFGQKYRFDEAHPTGGHPDGWFEINAATEQQARELIVADCGTKWSFMYDHEPDKNKYPLGCIGILP